jgi:hypothetical protein
VLLGRRARRHGQARLAHHAGPCPAHHAGSETLAHGLRFRLARHHIGGPAPGAANRDLGSTRLRLRRVHRGGRQTIPVGVRNTPRNKRVGRDSPHRHGPKRQPRGMWCGPMLWLIGMHDRRAWKTAAAARARHFAEATRRFGRGPPLGGSLGTSNQRYGASISRRLARIGSHRSPLSSSFCLL